MKLFPRQERFYEFFLSQARIILEAARLLLEGAQAGNAELASAAAMIRTLEQRGDEVIHEIYTRLNQTFITPLDPEDIHAISSALDDVLDGIEDTAHRLVAYHINPIPLNMVSLAEIVARCAKQLQQAFELEGKGSPQVYCIEINRLENEGDLVGRSAIVDLFAKEKDPITLIKLKEVYDFFEETIDSCEDVADVLQNVVVKNS